MSYAIKLRSSLLNQQIYTSLISLSLVIKVSNVGTTTNCIQYPFQVDSRKWDVLNLWSWLHCSVFLQSRCKKSLWGHLMTTIEPCFVVIVIFLRQRQWLIVRISTTIKLMLLFLFNIRYYGVTTLPTANAYLPVWLPYNSRLCLFHFKEWASFTWWNKALFLPYALSNQVQPSQLAEVRHHNITFFHLSPNIVILQRFWW